MQSSLMIFFPNLLLLEASCQSSSSVSTCLARPAMLVAEREAAGECGGGEVETARGPVGREREECWVAENGLLL